VHRFVRSDAFQATVAPLLIVDTDLVIRDANPAYLRATQRTRDDLLGVPIFEAFPDNPDDPDASGVANLNASFETVLRRADRHRMPLQRYDIPIADGDHTGFARKFWLPVNTPLLDGDGRVVGALHHVEDVTGIIDSVHDDALVRSGVRVEEQTWAALVVALARETAAHQQARRTVDQLQDALESRILIEQAKGMIAAQRGVHVDHAFTMLRAYARRHGTGLRAVARGVIEGDLAI
jgi:hypothetical protein